MRKRAQSLLDFVNIFPLQAIQIRRSILSNDEAKTLYRIWQGERDHYNNPIVPQDTDPLILAALTSKGLIKNKQFHNAGADIPMRVVEFTDKGRAVIRNIILQTEQSAFERTADKELNYEAVHNTIYESGKKSAEKTASKKPQAGEARVHNWLTRATEQWKSCCERTRKG